MARKLIAFMPQEKGFLMMEEAPLGRGGEGSVYSVLSHELSHLPPAEELVVKLYHQPHEGDRVNKVKAMVKYAPDSSSVAWPLAVILSPDGSFLGYAMQKLASKTFRPWADLAHAKSRRGAANNFDVRYGITAIRNLAVALISVHHAGHKVGDINESNIFVGADARVLIVDTDSAQISTADGKIFPCLVGKPEYTAPELSHGPLKDQERTVATDVFGFAVAAYQMLTGGAHPTDGAFSEEGDPPTVVERMRRAIYPGLDPAHAGGFTHPKRIAIEGLPRSLRSIFLASLSPDPSRRPTLAAWASTLDGLLPHLQQCPKVKHHWYDGRDGVCGWCAHASRGLPDPWSDQATSAQSGIPRQFALPSVNFEDSSEGPVVRRAAPAAAGHQAAQAHQAAGGQHSAPAGNPSQQNFPPGYAFPPGGGPVQPQQSNGQQPTPPAPQQAGGKKPTTYKGRTIISYADGSEGPRPPLGLLLRGNPKLALHCIKNETPGIAKFWWPASRDLANPVALGVGFAVALILAVVWVMALPPLLEDSVSIASTPLLQVGAMIAGFGAVMASAWLTFSGLWDRGRAKKSAGDLSQFKPESLPKTVFRYVGISVVYGPLLVLGIIAAIIALVFNVLIGLLRNTAAPRSY